MIEREMRPLLVTGTALLSDAGIPSARADAELLASHVAGVSRAMLPLSEPMTSEQAQRYGQLLALRAARVPLQHLTGTAPFRRLEIAVGPGVFIPRPETELLVEWGLDCLSVLQDAPIVVDLCSGSGAIAVAVADEHPAAVVHAVEADPAALPWLVRNTERSGVTVVPGDATDPAVLRDLDGTADLVLCNPPYVPTGTMVEPEVADHDPRIAVFGGPDGLDVIRSIVTRAADLLRPGGQVGIEHDDSHGGAVVALFEADGRYTSATDHRDLAGRPRFATAVRREIAPGGLADCRP